MLEQRIIATLKFFDLQEMPLTVFEVHKYLLADQSFLRPLLDSHYELAAFPDPIPATPLAEVVETLDQLVSAGQLSHDRGYYFLPEKNGLVEQRLRNYLNGMMRERLVRRYLPWVSHLPFIRGIALAGSQALGQQRPGSDIDLLIITHHRFMWLARTWLTVYFQLLGIRRYGSKIANRFCLNHYLATIRPVDAERNLYKAMEYLKLRPVVYPSAITAFQQANEQWIRLFFPNAEFPETQPELQSDLQRSLETLLTNKLGVWLEQRLKLWQLGRIKQDKFIFVRDDELSFHPDSKHEPLLRGFFGSL